MPCSTDDAWRLLSANRRAYDSPVPFPPELAMRIAALERELAALHESTSWRMTRPLRALITLIRTRLPRSRVACVLADPVQPVGTYSDWIDRTRPREKLAGAEIGKRRVQDPKLGLVLLGATGAHDAQAPSGCQLLLMPEGSGQAVIDFALSKMDVDFICFLDAADLLEPDAMAVAQDSLAREPYLDMVFADEDWLEADGSRTRPFLKPSWDAELQRGRDLAGPFVVLRASLLRASLLRGLAVAPGPAWQYELASRVAALSRPERIRHIAAVLCHRSARPDGQDRARAAVARVMLAEERTAAQLVPIADSPGLQRIVYDVPVPAPLVSIIVPSRDRPDLLSVCADGILNRTSYEALELLIVDNGSCEPEALALLDTLAQDRRVRVLRQPGAFNWSALNNHAAREAAGEILVLLNNDIAVRQPGWLAELVSQAVQPGVGVVGAKLLYPDGRIQHAGLTTQFERALPRHILHFASHTAGPCALLALAREVWGVTGACMAVRRSIFFSVGGLNEALAVSCNDVDFCLRLRAAGYRIIWTPWAELDHHELASRGDDVTAEQQARAQDEHDRLRRDWGNLMRDDPHYPPAFDHRTELLPFFYAGHASQ